MFVGERLQRADRPREQTGDVHLGEAEPLRDVALHQILLEAEAQGCALTPGEVLEQLREIDRGLGAGVARVHAADQGADGLGLIGVVDRTVQRDRSVRSGQRARLDDALCADAAAGGEFVDRRCAPQLACQRLRGVVQFRDSSWSARGTRTIHPRSRK